MGNRTANKNRYKKRRGCLKNLFLLVSFALIVIVVGKLAADVLVPAWKVERLKNATLPAWADVQLIDVDGGAYISASENNALADYKTPSLTVYETPNENYKKSVNAISPEKAAEIGAQYIWEMYGEGLDGKSVEMTYVGHPSGSRAYWHGKVANTKEDLKMPDSFETYPAEEGAALAATNIAAKELLYLFSVDAVTGERVSIYSFQGIPETKDLGAGKTYNLSPVQMEAMQYQAPSNVAEYAEIAREFTGKHFEHTKVASVDFVRISLNFGDRDASTAQAKAYRDAYKAGKDKPFTFTLYEKGRGITFNVTDDTGRVAIINIDMDTKQVTNLDTTDSDFVPGFNADAPGAVG